MRGKNLFFFFFNQDSRQDLSLFVRIIFFKTKKFLRHVSSDEGGVCMLAFDQMESLAEASILCPRTCDVEDQEMPFRFPTRSSHWMMTCRCT